ncbi:MAG: NAD-dependent epimerase/dehydratase family protein [Rhodopila sp.]
MSQFACAVTGANGFVGRAVCRHFEAAGWRVVKLVRSPDGEGGEARRFALDEDAPLAALSGIDTVVHAAYDFSLRSWADIRRINVRGSERLFDAASRGGVRRQIFVSSMAAYEGCRSMYGRGKLAAEEAACARGGLVVRPGVIYITGCGFLKAVKFGCKPPWSWIFCRRQRIG